MLINAVAVFYQAGRIKKAGQIYSKLKARYPLDEFKVPMVTFVKKRLAKEMKDLDIKDATEMIMMTLGEAYFRYAIHEDDMAFAREKWAKEVFDVYVLEFNTADDSPMRLNMPDFPMLRYLALIGFINNDFYPEYLRQGLLNRIEIERPELFDKLQKQESILNKKFEKQKNN